MAKKKSKKKDPGKKEEKEKKLKKKASGKKKKSGKKKGSKKELKKKKQAPVKAVAASPVKADPVKVESPGKKKAQAVSPADQSSNYNVRDAVSKLKQLKGLEEVAAFTKGEKRVTVTRAIQAVKSRLSAS